MAMNLAAICAGERGWHAAQPRGARGVAVQYAQHVKDEAIDSLTLDEARIVLRLAADAARARAREELYRLLSSATVTHAAAVAAWCNGYVQEYILSFIHEHDNGHDRFLQQLQQAKR